MNIQLPWSLSSVPLATFYILIGKLFSYKQGAYINLKYYMLILAFLCTFLLSRYYHIDMAWNNVLPLFPILLPSLSGFVMISLFSSILNEKFKGISMLFQKIGRETFLILALSQIIILYINSFFHFNFIIKNCLLFTILIAFYFIKQEINRVLKRKIL